MSLTREMKDGRWYCDWFDESGKIQNKEFPEEALQPAEPPKKKKPIVG